VWLLDDPRSLHLGATQLFCVVARRMKCGFIVQLILSRHAYKLLSAFVQCPLGTMHRSAGATSAPTHTWQGGDRFCSNKGLVGKT
jgi:hypothetical protein